MPRDCRVHECCLLIVPRVIVGNIRTDFSTFEDMLGLNSMPFLYHFCSYILVKVL